MIPPYQQRGIPVSPSAFNALIDEVRSSQLTAITGGTFQRSISGTNINILSTVSGGGSSSPLDTPLCYFKVTDASEGTTLKVEVQQDQIAGRYPDGMGLGFPAFKLTISGNCYIYAKVLFDTTTLQIDAGSEAITVLQSNELQENTDSEQYILIATVLTKTGPARIDTITNICAQPVPNACALAWSD
jgi:hypothetical protein